MEWNVFTNAIDCYRLLDVRHAQQSPTEIRLMLVFEYIDQDLSTYLQRCPSPGLGPERIRVCNSVKQIGKSFIQLQEIVYMKPLPPICS